MAERDGDMTPDELEQFEKTVVHHETDESGPASEPDVQHKQQPENPVVIPVVPNPD